MTSIHDDGPGSPRKRRLERAALSQLECERLARRVDELEAVLTVGGIGYGRLRAGSDSLEANSRFKAEWGFAPDANIDWSQLAERACPEDRGRLADAARHTLDSGAPLALILCLGPAGAGRRWLALAGRRVDPGEGPGPDLILTAHDVTTERRAVAGEIAERTRLADNERRSREQAEAANRAKDELLSVISHELRSPLAAILGWTRILALKHREDPEVAAITPRIERSAKAQLKMLDDLLDLGRLGSGQLRIEPRPMDLAGVAALAIEAARPAAVAKRIEIESRFAAGDGRLRGDPDRLQQVIGNLLSNAVKFTGPGGRIRVEVRQRDAFAELAVQDNGQGIAPERLPHLFDRFRQADSSGSRHPSGLGLGLTLVREIVTLHGGSVCAESRGAGLGTTFLVRLPAARPGPAAAGGDDRAGSGGQECRHALEGFSILVVDDEPEARTVIAETLRRAGALVTVADSAMAALERLTARDAHFDIVVTDIGMPEQDGYSLVRELRSLQVGRRMLVIAVTGHVSTGDAAAAMAAGFDLHVPKPVDFDTFVPQVRRLAAWRQSLAASD